MNKWALVLVSVVLSVSVILVGVLYNQKSTELDITSAELADIVAELTDTYLEVDNLNGNVLLLEGNVIGLEIDLEISLGEIAQLIGMVSLAEAESLKTQEQIRNVTSPRHFESLKELTDWIAQDDTNSRIRWANLPVWEKVWILQVQALRDGFLLVAWFIDVDLDGEIDFAGNLAWVGDELYYIWVLDDSITLYASKTPLIPSVPLGY